MKALVTGGAGFIGSHLAASLCGRGDQVTVFDNFSSGKLENIEGLDLTLIEGDLLDRLAIADAVRGMDIVFHQAALCSVSKSMADPVMTLEINAGGTLQLLEACRLAGVRRVVMASSSAVYGNSEAQVKSEDMATDPLSPYALSKLIDEYYCRMYWDVYGLETVALRYFNVFGPRQDPASEYSAVIPRFLKAMLGEGEPHIYGDGSQSRDFTFVADVVNANILAAFSPMAAGQVMNIACGKRCSLIELLDKLDHILDRDTRPVNEAMRPGDVMHSQACIEKARRLIGFSPGVSLDTGLRDTAAWYIDYIKGGKLRADNAVSRIDRSTAVSPAPNANVSNGAG